MDFNPSICKASEVVALVKRREREGRPFHAVISIEHPGAATKTAEEGRAPRLAEEIGPKWRERQLILVCWDLERPQKGTTLPGPEIVHDAFAHADRWQPESGSFDLLVHCRSAKARSAGLLIAFLRRHLGAGSKEASLDWLLRLQPKAAPNIVIVQHGDDYLGCGGALVRAVENDPGVTIRREDAEKARRRQIESGALLTPVPR
jgi:predicted protein tyrosine phosphatase